LNKIIESFLLKASHPELSHDEINHIEFEYTNG